MYDFIVLTASALITAIITAILTVMLTFREEKSERRKRLISALHYEVRENEEIIKVITEQVGRELKNYWRREGSYFSHYLL